MGLFGQLKETLVRGAVLDQLKKWKIPDPHAMVVWLWEQKEVAMQGNGWTTVLISVGYVVVAVLAHFNQVDLSEVPQSVILGVVALVQVVQRARTKSPIFQRPPEA